MRTGVVMRNCKPYKVINLPLFRDERGVLTFAEAQTMIPFEIKRLFWIYGIPEGKTRAGHAHKTCQQAIIPIHGSFDIFITNGKYEETITMNEPNEIIAIPAGVWCELKNFSKDAVVLVATSEHFDADDYLQPYNEFLEFIETCK
ncbi:MAG: FdtA/QdtA family cupin domain-containing protein [Bacteroidaceae bacterium]|nr:FdtA/QdtA family cupin domain-containing protein [Bacteroidaceae bacterium]